MRGDGMFAAEGALIEGVTTGSPAEKAGLKQGDLILSVDGTTSGCAHQPRRPRRREEGRETRSRSPSPRGARRTAHDVKVTLDKNPSKDAPFLGVQYLAAPPRFGGDRTATDPTAAPG